MNDHSDTICTLYEDLETHLNTCNSTLRQDIENRTLAVCQAIQMPSNDTNIV